MIKDLRFMNNAKIQNYRPKGDKHNLIAFILKS
jgi:hypothetical protein